MTVNSTGYVWDDAFTAPVDTESSAGLFKAFCLAQMPSSCVGERYKRCVDGELMGVLHCFWLSEEAKAAAPEDPDCLWHIFFLGRGKSRLVGYCFHPALQPFCEAVVAHFEEKFPEIKQRALSRG